MSCTRCHKPLYDAPTNVCTDCGGPRLEPLGDPHGPGFNVYFPLPGTHEDGWGEQVPNTAHFTVWAPRPGRDHWSADHGNTVNENAGDGKFGAATFREATQVFTRFPYGREAVAILQKALNQ